MQYQRLRKEELVHELQKHHKRIEVLETEAGIRTQTVQALIESKENYRLLFETMAQGVVFQSLSGEITSANPTAEVCLVSAMTSCSEGPQWTPAGMRCIRMAAPFQGRNIRPWLLSGLERLFIMS